MNEKKENAVLHRSQGTPEETGEVLKIHGEVSMPGKKWEIIKSSPVYFITRLPEQHIVRILKDSRNLREGSFPTNGIIENEAFIRRQLVPKVERWYFKIAISQNSA